MSQLKNNVNRKNVDDTATRILDAAEVLFAEKGFAGTSSRDITSSAGCNLASINYYFGGKDNLYKDVCKRRLNVLRTRVVHDDRLHHHCHAGAVVSGT